MLRANLQAAHNKLIEYRQLFSPLPIESDQPYQHGYAINESTVKSLMREKELKNYNPYNLSEEQHKNLIITLSIILQITNELLDSYLEKPSIERGKHWTPLQNRDNVVFYYFYYHDENESKEKIKKFAVGFHLDNHAKIIGKHFEDKEEKVIQIIEKGDARTQSILDNLINIFIQAFSNIISNQKALQKFCKLLEPASDVAGCIDARIRMAIDYALSNDTATETFSEILQKAIQTSYLEFKEKHSFYTMLAVLMRDHWRTPFKADTGSNAVCITHGILLLNQEINCRLDVLIHQAITDITFFEPDDDILEAYSVVPFVCQTEFWQIATSSPIFIKVINKLSKSALSKLLDEAGIFWNEQFIPHINAKLSDEPYTLYALNVITDARTFAEPESDIKRILKLQWRKYIEIIKTKTEAAQFIDFIDTYRKYFSLYDFLQIILQADIIPDLFNKSDTSAEALKRLSAVMVEFISDKDYQGQYLKNDRLIDLLLTIYLPNQKTNLLGIFGLNVDHADVALLINRLSQHSVIKTLQYSGVVWRRNLPDLLQKIAPILLLQTLKNYPNFWSRQFDIFFYVIKLIAPKLDPKQLMELMDYHHVLKKASSDTNKLKDFVEKIDKFLSADILIQLIYKGQIIPEIKDSKDEDNLAKLQIIVNCLVKVAKLPSITHEAQVAFDALLQTNCIHLSRNVLAVISLNLNRGLDALLCVRRLSVDNLIHCLTVHSDVIWLSNGVEIALQRIINEKGIDTAVTFLSELKTTYSSDYQEFVALLFVIAKQLELPFLTTVLSMWDISLENLFDTSAKVEIMIQHFQNPSHLLKLLKNSGIMQTWAITNNDESKNNIKLIYNYLIQHATKTDLDLRDCINELVASPITSVSGKKSSLFAYYFMEYNKGSLFYTLLLKIISEQQLDRIFEYCHSAAEPKPISPEEQNVILDLLNSKIMQASLFQIMYAYFPLLLNNLLTHLQIELPEAIFLNNYQYPVVFHFSRSDIATKLANLLSEGEDPVSVKNTSLHFTEKNCRSSIGKFMAFYPTSHKKAQDSSRRMVDFLTLKSPPQGFFNKPNKDGCQLAWDDFVKYRHSAELLSVSVSPKPLVRKDLSSEVPMGNPAKRHRSS